MIRCCLCRRASIDDCVFAHERTEPPLPDGWRCVDHGACRRRVREIVELHRNFAATLDSPTC